MRRWFWILLMITILLLAVWLWSVWHRKKRDDVLPGAVEIDGLWKEGFNIISEITDWENWDTTAPHGGLGTGVIGSSSEQATQPIALSTNGATPANTDLWCFSGLNINFTGTAPDMTVRNVLDASFKSIITDLKCKAIQYAGGAITNIEQVIVNKTDYTLGGGYNCSNCSFGDGQCCPTVPFTQDFYLVMIELCKELGIRLDVDINIQLPDVTWQAQAAWKISYGTSQGVRPKHMLIGQENVTREYDDYWIGHTATNNADYLLKANNYVTKAIPELITLQLANPDIDFYLDSSSIEETGSRFTIWNTQLQGYTNQGFRQYFNVNNLLANPPVALSTTDWEYNLAVINTAVFTTAVQRLNDFHTAYPGKVAGVYQWGLRNPGVTPNLENTVVGMLYQAKMVKMMLDYNFSHGDLISYASYQDLKQFTNSDNSVQTFGLNLMLIGQLFSGSSVQYIPITFNLGDGVGGVATYDGTTYRILIYNDGGQPVTRSNAISLNGITVTSWNRESYNGIMLSGTPDRHSSAVESSINLPPYSISVLSFNA